MGKFRASVQYNDWKGSAAADGADQHDLTKHLKEKGLLNAGEFVVGVEAWIGENHGGPSKDPHVTVFVASEDSHDTVKQSLDAAADPLDLRKIELEIGLADFFGLFKRFEIVVTRKGLDLEDREYRD